MVLDRLAAKLDAGPRRSRYGALVASGRLGELAVVLLWPQTYMNDSGRAVSPARGELKLSAERIVVIHDDLDLPFGCVRVKFGGGHAGHNGLRSLIAGLGTPGFWRVRVGIDRPPTTDPEVVSRYVLSPFAEPWDEVEQALEAACARTVGLLEEGR